MACTLLWSCLPVALLLLLGDLPFDLGFSGRGILLGRREGKGNNIWVLRGGEGTIPILDPANHFLIENLGAKGNGDPGVDREAASTLMG